MITPIQAATVVNYLYAAQTISVVDDQDVVWADYLNAEIPEVLASDLLPACRQAIRDWAASGRSWRIDVGRYADAVRKLRRQRGGRHQAWGAHTRGRGRPAGVAQVAPGSDPPAHGRRNPRAGRDSRL